MEEEGFRSWQNGWITVICALVGLCLAVEHGFTGRQVQIAHMNLRTPAAGWPRFETPGQITGVTVEDILMAEEGARNDKIKRWAAAVWQAWQPHHDAIRRLCAPFV